jgi:hypothetical protein
MMEVKRATVNLQGSARLEEIRASLAAEKSGTSAVSSAPATPAIEANADGSAATSGVPSTDATKAPDTAG